MLRDDDVSYILPGDASTTKGCTDFARRQLVGRKIVRVRYATAAEAEAWEWSHRPLLLQLSGSMLLFAQCDDEATGPGALRAFLPVESGEPPASLLFPMIANAMP